MLEYSALSYLDFYFLHYIKRIPGQSMLKVNICLGEKKIENKHDKERKERQLS